MEMTFAPEHRAFREEVRAWLKEGMPPHIRAKAEVDAQFSQDEVMQWHRVLYRKGWVAPHWPKEHGGPGLDVTSRFILAEELELAGAPHLSVFGLSMVGPLLMQFGNEAQKQRFLPKILSGEEVWCQGYSEPNAGSDLASLQTRAVKDGEYYVVNGQKVWTSLAHIADWMMLLARTDPDAPKHKGITYFLLDMKSPGVTVKPLKQITGDAEFNEVYFDNVRIHESQILGGVNNGWGVGLTTLMYERLALGFGIQVRLRIALDGLVELARHTVKNGVPVTQDPIIRQKLAQMWIDTEVFKYTGARAITKLLKGDLPGPEASTGKMMWVEGHQRLQELAMEIEGPFSQLTQGSPWAVAGGMWQHTFLRSRANSIEGGTTEIQRNIIGERVLGLPKG